MFGSNMAAPLPNNDSIPILADMFGCFNMAPAPPNNDFDEEIWLLQNGANTSQQRF